MDAVAELEAPLTKLVPVAVLPLLAIVADTMQERLSPAEVVFVTNFADSMSVTVQKHHHITLVMTYCSTYAFPLSL